MCVRFWRDIALCINPYYHRYCFVAKSGIIVNARMGEVLTSICVCQQAPVSKRYLQCPALVTIAHLKKFLRLKYELNPTHLVSIRTRLSLHLHQVSLTVTVLYLSLFFFLTELLRAIKSVHVLGNKK